MEMTFNEYTSKMFSILETAIYNYEINTLVEAADGEDNTEKKESRWATLKAVAKKVLNAIWTAIKTFFQKIAAKANELINKPVTLMDDMTTYPGATKFDSTLMRYANEFASGKVDNVDEAIKYMDTVAMTDKFSKGSEVNTRGIAGTVKKYLAAIEKLEKVTFNGDDEALKTAQTAIKRVVGILKSYANQANELLNAKLAQDIATKRDALKAKSDKLDAEMNAKAHDQTIKERKSMGESVEADDVALSARLILEAANLLREDAEDYVDGIEGGEGTQKDIDDIPEEKPVVTDEYPADDITGGEGEKIDQEEIKDLLDGDKEAIAILNDDEGGKAITESVVIRF